MTDHIKPKTSPPANVRTPIDRGKPYLCPELQRNPGIDDARFEAFRLPSRMGDQLIYPKRTP